MESEKINMISSPRPNLNETSNLLTKQPILMCQQYMCNEIITNITNKLGFTLYHMIMVIAIWCAYLGEGAQMQSFNMLMPILKNMYSFSELNILASSVFIGFVLGSAFSSILTNYYTRGKVVKVAMITYSLFSIIIIFFNNFFIFAICRFLIGVCIGVYMPQLIVNLSEILPNNNIKDLIIVSVNIFFRFGVIYFMCCFVFIMPNYAMDNYRPTMLSTNIPIIISTLLIIVYFRDSPKILLEKNNLEQIIINLEYVSKFSATYRIPSYDIEFLKDEFNKMTRYKDLTLLDNTKIKLDKVNIRLIILITTLFVSSSMINVTSMYSLPLMLYNLSIEEHLNHTNNFEIIILTQVVTVPAIIIAALIAKPIGKKYTILIGYIPCFIASVMPLLINNSLITSCSLINFFILFASCSNKLYILDVFPTSLRHTALGICLCLSKIGDTFTPLLCNISFKYWFNGPIILICVLAFIGSIFGIILPNDKKKKV
jgi:MFS family permease